MADQKEVRVRVAPSPTGDPHVGTAYIALFDYVFARHAGGKFVLRIEDTDRTRSTQESEDAILRALRWVGLEWDEGPDVGGPYGPYRQSERGEIYRQYAMDLVASGHAYPCFCAAERLADLRAEQSKAKQDPMYDSLCRSIPPEDAKRRMDAGKAHVIRLSVPDEGETVVHDRLRGDVAFKNALIDDQILLKSDGFPTYHLANVVDDHLMEITHVLRAEEWLPSTPRHMLLYAAFGWDPPQWVHLPLVLGTDRSKLSKRHGATDVDAYRTEGYLPEAIINFLALLGWSPGENREIFTVDELIDRFSIEGLTAHPAIFDITKLQWMNGEYIRMMTPEALAERCLPFLVEDGMFPAEPSEEQKQYLREVVALLQERMKLLKEVTTVGDFFFLEDIHYDEKAVSKWLKKEDTARILTAALEALHEVESWNLDSIEIAIREAISYLGLASGGEMIHRLRSAITGRTVGPGLFETMAVLGRDRCLSRIRFALQTYAGESIPG